jgi:hypothetical protein
MIYRKYTKKIPEADISEIDDSEIIGFIKY